MSESISNEGRLSNEQEIYAAATLNETEENREAAIAIIRQWILDYEQLHAPTDDFTILRFLRSCKFDIEKTKLKFQNYYAQRTALPDWFDNRDPFLPELQELFDLGVFLPLRKVDQEGKLHVLIRAAVHDPVKHKQSDVFKAGMMVLDVATRNHVSASLYGIVAILDLENVTAGHALQLPPSVIKTLVHSWQGCYPIRIRSLNFVNAPVYVNVVLKIFKTFMSQKLKHRMYVHTRGMKEFCKTLPADMLPSEYGGTDGSIKDLKDYWKRTVEENRTWLIEDEKYKMTVSQ